MPWLAAVIPNAQPMAGHLQPPSTTQRGGEASTCQAPWGGNLLGHTVGNGVMGWDIHLPGVQTSPPMLAGWGKHGGNVEGLAV